MKASEIVHQVRLCIDKEKHGDGMFNTSDDMYLDNIIKSHIGDALFWCSYYGSLQLLNGASSVSGGVVEYRRIEAVEKRGDGLYGVIELPDNFVKLIRIRMDGWHKSISNATLTAEDSDEYLSLLNDIERATVERPVASIIDSVPKRLEVHPYAEGGELTMAVSPLSVIEGDDSEVDILPTIRTGFFYYLAFLTLSAYGDSNANQMLEIAKMNIGLMQSNDKK